MSKNTDFSENAEKSVFFNDFFMEKMLRFLDRERNNMLNLLKL